MLATLTLAILFARDTMPEARLTRLGGFHRGVSTDSVTCQSWFDQGLAMLYGFQYGGAERCFTQAAHEDPECAMARWGMAAANGPFINRSDVGAAASKEAIQDLQLAKKAVHASPLERELIDAQEARFSQDGPADRTKLNRDYADAMGKVWARHPDDADVGALFGEALVDERPWDQWSKSGAPSPGTLEAIATFREVLKRNPRHPQALHMLIHAEEASPHPEDALQAADTLLNLQPDLGHMQHMPVHIYNRTGEWEKSVKASLVAISQSRTYMRSRRIEVGGPSVDHYDHALAYAASMDGQSAIALQALNLKEIGGGWLEKNGPDYDSDLALPIKVMQRFGKWEEILHLPDFGPKMPQTRAMQLGARAVALAALGRLEEAKVEQAKFGPALEAVPAAATWDEFIKARELLGIESHIMNGEILIRESGHEAEAISELRLAVKSEDALHYEEPPTWIQPTRHVLGAALLKVANYKEAEAVFREDLQRSRPNGWSLYGLGRALEGEGRTAEARETMRRFQAAWRFADIKIDSSCLCLPGR